MQLAIEELEEPRDNQINIIGETVLSRSTVEVKGITILQLRN